MEDSQKSGSALSLVDTLCIGAYFLILYLIIIHVSKRQTAAAASNVRPSEAYFLAERKVPWWAISASLFASNIGTEHFVGLAGGAARDGIAIGFFEIGAVPAILFLGFFFLPVYMNNDIQTTPDYLERRYNRVCKTIVVIHALFIYIFTKVSVTLYAGQLILNELVDINKYISVLILVIGTAAYTISGGLGAVVYTESLQTIILLMGGLLVLVFSMSKATSLTNVRLHFENSNDAYFLHIFRPNTDENYPWSGFVFGYYATSLWYWGIDQVIVQRAMAAQNLMHGQAGTIGAALLKLLPFMLMVLPGIAARILIDLEGDDDFDYNRAYPYLVKTVVPMNLRGIIVAGMLASLMSSLASVFNSSSTLVSLNIWKMIYPQTDEAGLVFIGRATVALLATLSILWLPMVPLLNSSLFIVVQTPAVITSGPILALFLWGMLSKVPNSQAAVFTLVIGLSLGFTRFLLHVIESVTPESLTFGFITSMNFLNFGALNFLISTITLFVASHICTYSKSFDGEGGIDKNLFFWIRLSNSQSPRDRVENDKRNEIEFTTLRRHASDESNGMSINQEGDDITDLPLGDANVSSRKEKADSLDNDWSEIDINSDDERNVYNGPIISHHVFSRQKKMLLAVNIILVLWAVMIFTLA